MAGRAATALVVAAAAAVLVACGLLSRQLGPVWVAWALAALSFGLGLLVARATSARPGAPAERAVFEAELKALHDVTGRLARLLEEGEAAGARRLAPGIADLLAQSEQTADALSDLEAARLRFAQRLASMACGLELLEVALRHRDAETRRLQISTFVEQGAQPNVQP